MKRISLVFQLGFFIALTSKITFAFDANLTVSAPSEETVWSPTAQGPSNAVSFMVTATATTPTATGKEAFKQPVSWVLNVLSENTDGQPQATTFAFDPSTGNGSSFASLLKGKYPVPGLTQIRLDAVGTSGKQTATGKGTAQGSSINVTFAKSPLICGVAKGVLKAGKDHPASSSFTVTGAPATSVTLKASTSDLNVSDVSPVTPAPGLSSFKVVGTTAPPGMDAYYLSVNNSSGEIKGSPHLPVQIVYPASIKKDPIPATPATSTQVFGSDDKSDPGFTIFHLQTLWSINTTVTVLDQLGNTLDSVYDGSAATEGGIPVGVPAATVKGGSYTDPVGTSDNTGNVLNPIANTNTAGIKAVNDYGAEWLTNTGGVFTSSFKIKTIFDAAKPVEIDAISIKDALKGRTGTGISPTTVTGPSASATISIEFK